MLLRLRGPDGMLRLTVDGNDSFGDLAKEGSRHYYPGSSDDYLFKN